MWENLKKAGTLEDNSGGKNRSDILSTRPLA
jgi:hypothetical protein